MLLFNLMNLGFGSNYYCEALLAIVTDIRINFDHAFLMTLFISVGHYFFCLSVSPMNYGGIELDALPGAITVRIK